MHLKIAATGWHSADLMNGRNMTPCVKLLTVYQAQMHAYNSKRNVNNTDKYVTFGITPIPAFRCWEKEQLTPLLRTG